MRDREIIELEDKKIKAAINAMPIGAIVNSYLRDGTEYIIHNGEIVAVDRRI